MTFYANAYDLISISIRTYLYFSLHRIYKIYFTKSNHCVDKHYPNYLAAGFVEVFVRPPDSRRESR